MFQSKKCFPLQKQMGLIVCHFVIKLRFLNKQVGKNDERFRMEIKMRNIPV